MNPNQPSAGQPVPPLPQDPSKPVAYDQYGRPLYAHPQNIVDPEHGDAAPAQSTPQIIPDPKADNSDPESSHQTVFMSRPADPPPLKITPEVAQRHADSARRYPDLNLSEAEYVIKAVRRHPIGIFQIWAVALALIFTFGVFAVFMLVGNTSVATTFIADPNSARGLVIALFGIVIVLATLGGFVATYIYNSNRFFLTNESVIQEIRTSILSHNEQTVSLANIEDASFRQDGILASIFNYGTIRLSTEGDETTYRFSYVAAPKQHIATLNNAIEAFKNGRPIED